MKNILSLTLIILIFSCSNNRPKKSVHTTQNLVIDTALYSANHKGVKHWSDLSDYYGVYRFANNITGIGFETLSGIDKTLLDSLYQRGTSGSDSTEKDVLVDTTGSYSIHYSKKLSDLILDNDTAKIFYIYCTRGMTKATIEKVLYGTTDCTSVLILNLSKIDTQQFGQPVIASKKRINVSFKCDQRIQKAVSINEMLMNEKADYKDSIRYQQFAYNSQLFFTYSDDFKWFGAKEGSKCLFPSRSAYRISGNSAKIDWSDSLDLFGIPCD
jgi:hypothetical protein